MLTAILLVWKSVSVAEFGLFFVLSLMRLISHTLITNAIGRGGLILVRPREYSGFIWASVFAWLIWDESITFVMVFGFLFIIVSGVLIASAGVERSPFCPSSKIYDYVETNSHKKFT
jgi:drug/metabolite transporter (DMT)-like permease